VHDERVEIVGQALRRVGEAALVEVVDERQEPLLCTRSLIASSSARQ
jgi:hypothetical protein